DAGLRELVLGERGAAPGAPLRGPVAHVQPAALMDELEELPDVLDVRVAEREVVVAPVHPLTKPDRAAGQGIRGLDDNLATASRELLDAVFLDLTLRIQPERTFHADLDPEALAVESVLVALLEATQRLIALEDVLQGPGPRSVNAERRSVGLHRPVDER